MSTSRRQRVNAWLVLAPLLFCVNAVFSQNADRQYRSHRLNNNTLEIKVSDGQYRISLLSPHIVETSFAPTGETFDPHSFAVVLKPQKIPVKLVETRATLGFRTGPLAVIVNKQPFQIRYEYRGRNLLSEKTGYFRRQGIDPTDADDTQVLEGVSFNLEPDEDLYGGGSRALGMNRRGLRLPLYNRAHYGYETRSDQMSTSLPLMMSSKIYAVHFDNPARGTLDLDSSRNNTLTFECVGGRKTWQIIAADDWPGLVEHYTALTGRQPLPPRWALGNFASRFGYRNESEVRTTASLFRRENIPLDAIVLDLYWFGKDVKGPMGNLAFDRDTFPNAEGMMRDLRDQGIKTVLVTEPFVLTTSKRWPEVVAKDVLAKNPDGHPAAFEFFFGETGLIDLFGAKGRDWFWDIYRDLTQKGVAGWWGDLGEPEVHPSFVQHANGPADWVHNAYGHEWARLLAEGYQRDFPAQRPFILMRSGFSGSQRFGLMPWSGDVSRTWGGLQSQPEIALQMGMQGLAYMHSDLGGFAGSNRDDELYVRWLQYGVFQPIFRPHAQDDVPPEPVYRDPPTRALAKAAIELRYRLLPYNYTLAFENHRSGLPLMRPLLFEASRDPEQRNRIDAYFWGQAFLVSPVIDYGVTQQTIRFPAGNNWFDFYTEQKIAGGSTQTVDIVRERIPVFVRAGSFVPMAPLVQTTDHYTSREVDLHYYHEASVTTSNGLLYHDDGITPEAFEKGLAETLHFQSKAKGSWLEIGMESRPSKRQRGMDRTIRVHLHGLEMTPQQVLINQTQASGQWDAIRRVLSVPVQWPATSKRQRLRIQLAVS